MSLTVWADASRLPHPPGPGPLQYLPAEFSCEVEMELMHLIPVVLATLAVALFVAVLLLYLRKRYDYTDLLQQAERRSEELKLLTEIGQAVSSRLDPDEVLRTVWRELGRL